MADFGITSMFFSPSTWVSLLIWVIVDTWCLWEELNTGKTSSASREREDFKAKRSQLGTAPCCSLKMSPILLTAMKKHSAGKNNTLNIVWLFRWLRGDESHKKYQEEQVFRMPKSQLEHLLTCAWWEANGLQCHGLGFSRGTDILVIKGKLQRSRSGKGAHAQACSRLWKWAQQAGLPQRQPGLHRKLTDTDRFLQSVSGYQAGSPAYELSENVTSFCSTGMTTALAPSGCLDLPVWALVEERQEKGRACCGGKVSCSALQIQIYFAYPLDN